MGRVYKTVISLLLIIKNLLNTLLLLGLISNLSSQSVQKFIYDPLEQTTIPYTNIYIKDGNKGWVSDKNGAFVYDEKDIKETDVLVFSALGYQKKTTPYFLVKDCTLINLEQRHVTLKEVEIKTRRYKKARLGKKRKANDNFHQGIRNINLSETEPEAIFIPNHIQAEGIIDEIKIFIQKGSIIPFKIQLYDAYLLDGSPKNSLLQEPLIIKEEQDRVWLSVDVSKENISIPKHGFFIAIDWNIDSIYYEKPDTVIREIYYKNEKKPRQDTIISNGIVIGEYFTHDWNRWRYNNDDEWINIWLHNYINFYSKDPNYKRDNKNHRYQTFAIYANILYDKSAKKYQEDVLDKNGIADDKLTNKILKKSVGKVKESSYNYHQSTLEELLQSVKKAFKNNDDSYLKTHLVFYTYEELELIANDSEQFSCNNQCIESNTKLLNDLISNLKDLKLKEIEPNYYQLTFKNFTTTLLFRNGKWKISPTSYKK